MAKNIYASDNYVIFEEDGVLNSFTKRAIYSEQIDNFIIKEKSNEKIINFQEVGTWQNQSNVPYTTETLRTFLRQNTGFSSASGSSDASPSISQKVSNYSQLSNGQEVGEISYVENSQGTAWLPSTMGGTYYPKGWYVWNGTEWVSDRNAIANQLETTINDVIANKIDNEVIVKQASDLANIDSSKVYIIDGKIDMGTQSIVVPEGGFYYKGLDYFVSCLYSTEQMTLFTSPVGGYSGNIRGTNVSHYMVHPQSTLFFLDNQGNGGSAEFLSCNFGDFSTITEQLGYLYNYRQFRLNDTAIIKVRDGFRFLGTWSGGFSITDCIVLASPTGARIFIEGDTSLQFQGSSFSNINALGVSDNAPIFGFKDYNFLADEGFSLNGARFKIGTEPIPFMSETTTKRYFKNCRAVKNTFPGGAWEVTTQQTTTLTVGTASKANGITSYSDLAHFSAVGSNNLICDSTIEKDYVASGQLVIDGGPNDEISVIIRKWNNLTASYEDVRTFTRNISNISGGLDIAYFNLYATTSLLKDDRIEIWVRNNTDNTNITMLAGSFLTVNLRN